MKTGMLNLENPEVTEVCVFLNLRKNGFVQLQLVGAVTLCLITLYGDDHETQILLTRHNFVKKTPGCGFPEIQNRGNKTDQPWHCIVSEHPNNGVCQNGTVLPDIRKLRNIAIPKFRAHSSAG